MKWTARLETWIRRTITNWQHPTRRTRMPDGGVWPTPPAGGKASW